MRGGMSLVTSDRSEGRFDRGFLCVGAALELVYRAPAALAVIRIVNYSSTGDMLKNMPSLIRVCLVRTVV